MPRHPAPAPDPHVLAVAAPEDDPRLDGKDPSMIPGHPLCNYPKYLAEQPLVDIVMQGDHENRQFKTFRLSFNGFQSPDYPYNEMVMMPKPFAIQALLTGRASTTNVELRRELAGQIGTPHEGPLPGPFSGTYAGEKF